METKIPSIWRHTLLMEFGCALSSSNLFSQMELFSSKRSLVWWTFFPFTLVLYFSISVALLPISSPKSLPSSRTGNDYATVSLILGDPLTDSKIVTGTLDLPDNLFIQQPPVPTLRRRAFKAALQRHKHWFAARVSSMQNHIPTNIDEVNSVVTSKRMLDEDWATIFLAGPLTTLLLTLLITQKNYGMYLFCFVSTSIDAFYSFNNVCPPLNYFILS